MTLYSVPPIEDESTPGLVTKIAGFSLHAGTVCEAWQRKRLERLCRYIKCGGKLRVIASIEDPVLIAKILGHVQDRDEQVAQAARAPPGLQVEELEMN